MYIYSEKTKKRYDTVDECLAAEKEFDEAEIKKQEEAEAKERQREARGREVKEAYDLMIKAENRYYDLVKQYNKDYNSLFSSLWFI